MKSYRELLSQTKEQKEAGLVEANVLEASFSMQESIQSVKNEIAIAEINLEKAKVALRQAEVKSTSNNEKVKGNFPFSAQVILDTIVKGRNDVTRAKVAVSNAESVLEQTKEALDILVKIQSELFPA